MANAWSENEPEMSVEQDAKLAAAVGEAVVNLRLALEAASAAGMTTYIHADDGTWEECGRVVEVSREYKF